MNEGWIPLLRCPVCGGTFDLDAHRLDGAEVLEAFLVCRECREVRPVLGGVASLPREWIPHARAHGSVYRRSPIGDPRMARFLFSHAWDAGEVVPFEEVIRRYGDLAPDATRGLAPVDAALERLLGEQAPARGRGLDVGCGVGRGVFLLAARLGQALGLDPSVARIRRARNVATTDEPFLVPRVERGTGPRDVALDLTPLVREGTAFAMADGGEVPLAAGEFDVVVVRDPASLDGARRALRPGGLLVTVTGEDVAGERVP